ncbi:acetyltransferase [Diplocarpon rosae]|nr:acetyltransferase [Diplocarpon rosae]
MGTPFINFLGPTDLHGYNRQAPATQQPDNIPKTFLDAMEVREQSLDPLPYIVDRATTYHDGREPYIKLGRLAVLQEFRGSGIAKMLVNSALLWAQQNATLFNPSILVIGMEKMKTEVGGEVPVWRGLVCVHAQKQVEKTWAKWGFKLDEEMGTWQEEGIEHVGMFTRLELQTRTGSG